MSINEIILRAIGTYFVLYILTRLMGRKQVSQLTFFNYVAGITIGSIAAQVSISSSITFKQGIVSLIVWASLTLIFAFINMKSKAARFLLDGQPEIVIKDGKIMEKALRRLVLDIDELTLLLRNQKIFSLEDVDYAILETNGKLSVLKKSDYQNVIRQDLNIQKAKNDAFPLPTEIIVDGRIMKKNLQKLNLNEEWVNLQLDQAGIRSVADVFYAQVQKNGSLYIDKRNDNLIQ